MRLLYCHPVSDDRGGHTCLATIDVELDADVRLYGLRLLRMRDGQYRLNAPQAGRRLAATFSPAFASRLTTMALEALGEQADAA